MKSVIHIGQKIGRLQIINTAPKKSGKPQWECSCDCGNIKMASTSFLLHSKMPSCGCYTSEIKSKNSIIHGHNTDQNGKSPEYRIWDAMIQRCTNPNCASYLDYGGRGIRVCARWMLFQNFIADMGNRPTKRHSLERNNNDGFYEKTNCRWATRIEQQYNRRNTIKVEYNGSMLTLLEISEKLNIPLKKVRFHLREKGHSVEHMINAKIGNNQFAKATNFH